jgi:hypothetical protein
MSPHPERVELIAALRRVRMTGPEIAEILERRDDRSLPEASAGCTFGYAGI